MAEAKEPKKFEDALAELEQVVRRLEGGDTTLEKSLELFERGVSLAGFCHQRLTEAQRRIESATRGEDGQLKLVPLDPEAPAGDASPAPDGGERPGRRGARAQ